MKRTREGARIYSWEKAVERGDKTMKKSIWLVVAVCCVGLVVAALRAAAEEKKEAAAETKAAMTKSVFVCPDCHVLALKAGKCTGCQKDLVERHVLGVKDGNALLCECGAACKCNTANMKDGKCGCGKEVGKISVKGMYVCADGCPEVSDKPGKCACGKDLKKAE
jgi:hypothetical protein